MYSRLNNFLHGSANFGKSLLVVGVFGFIGYKLTDNIKINKNRYGCYGHPKKHNTEEAQ